MNQLKLSTAILLAGILTGPALAHEKAKPTKKGCQPSDVICAKTVTSAFAPDGSLWRLWTAKQHLYYSVSKDDGRHFSKPQKVGLTPEKISSRGENRPKLGFDGKNNMYLSWAKPLSKRFTADVRFSYSTDGGKSFAPAVTVNNDGYEIGHSFNEMLVAEDGEVTLVWLDGRERKTDPKYHGSALYSAYGRIGDDGIEFSNTKLADQTCVCCRISMTYTADDKVAAMWRHIYDDNIRDHAITTFDDKNQQAIPYRASFDQWQINGCPHQGPGLSINKENRYHMVWFNNGTKGKGLFYAYSDDAGKSQSKPVSLGDFNKQSQYAHVVSTDKLVDVVWTQFEGDTYKLYHQRSTDNGENFSQAKVLADSKTDADRPFLIKRDGKHFVSWHRPDTGHKVIAL